MRSLLLVALIALPACAQSKDKWPSLAPRAIESATPGSAAPAQPATVSAPAAAVIDANARLTVIGREVDTLETRWNVQAKATAAAVTAARGSAPSSEIWSTAQLELTRLNQLGNQIDDMRVRLDRIAGDLAVAANGGADARAAIAATGAMIARVQALGAQHVTAFKAADAALPR
jgi:hypothetical protein